MNLYAEARGPVLCFLVGDPLQLITEDIITEDYNYLYYASEFEI